MSIPGFSVRSTTLIRADRYHTRCCADPLPKIVGDAVGIELFLKVEGYTLEELVLSNIVRKHAQDYVTV